MTSDETAVIPIDAVPAKAGSHRFRLAEMQNPRVHIVAALFILLLAQSFVATPARADLKICNRMSYVVEAAIGLDDKNTTATRGWFRNRSGDLPGRGARDNYC